jgi:malate dehydrogenase (oxaloacetate-decarboxylating)
MSDFCKVSLDMHKKNRGKFEIKSKVKIETMEDLSMAYSPCVGIVSKHIHDHPEEDKDYSPRGSIIGVISDGSAVLGLGDIGPKASYPVMEGKAILMKEFAGVDAIPIVLNTKDTEEIIQTIKNISTSFGGINLEDISAPRCFEIEEALQGIGIPVFHDDQHGTAIVVYAGLLNSLKVLGKKPEDCKVVVNGAGAAGIAVTKFIIKHLPAKDIILCDSRGIIYEGREDLNTRKKEITKVTNKENIIGDLATAMVDADVFIGVSKEGLVNKEMVKSMANEPIIFALANPTPEIMPEDARSAGAKIIATGRSDYPNQINNVLAFPGIFRGAIDSNAKFIDDNMKIAAAKALASYVRHPSVHKILPNPLEKDVAVKIAEAVKGAYSG